MKKRILHTYQLLSEADSVGDVPPQAKSQKSDNSYAIA